MLYVLCIISCPPQLAVKVSPFSGEYDGGRGAVECRLAERRDANHYLFGVQTNSGTGAYHYSFVVQTTIGL